MTTTISRSRWPLCGVTLSFMLVASPQLVSTQAAAESACDGLRAELARTIADISAAGREVQDYAGNIDAHRERRETRLTTIDNRLRKLDAEVTWRERTVELAEQMG